MIPGLASLYIDEADVVGIESPRSTLLEWLVQGEQKLTSISVVGMGGLGKTTIVKKVYDSQTVKRCFDCHSWITVSKSFTLVDLLRALLVGFMETTKDPAYMGIESMRESQLIDVLKNYLQQKRYVIVFDDIWSITAWEAVRYALPECNCGSRIIFTTRLIEVTTSVETTSHVYQLKPLQEKEALNLFCMKTFRGKDKGVCPHELESLSYSILKKCGGLPLAIVAIGGLLSKKNKNVFGMEESP
ncbi:Disease resistance protein [Quillaja saponaria]|uniref:Disease resistance protein n=1 Tax=Quillaja saponaria TaxID=32244 RepID=A0AAD7L9F0_QUISA|nr:Disease resistance protein [Quillaja saponaria]